MTLLKMIVTMFLVFTKNYRQPSHIENISSRISWYFCCRSGVFDNLYSP